MFIRHALRIARFDFIVSTREGRFWAALVLMSLLTVLCVASTQHAYRTQRAQQIAAAEETHEQFLDQGSKDPHSAAHYGMYAFKPVTLLSMVDPGVLPYTGVAIFMEPHRQNTSLFRPAEDESSSARFGSLSVSKLVLMFVPFLICGLLYDSVAGDRANGTLRQMLATGMTHAAFGAGKLLGAALKVAALLAPPAVLLMLMLIATDAGGLRGSLARLLALGVLYGLYALAWVSCRSRRLFMVERPKSCSCWPALCLDRRCTHSPGYDRRCRTASAAEPFSARRRERGIGRAHHASRIRREGEAGAAYAISRQQG